ncbi:hypothetical protein KJ662_05685, partial [Patescibacteria group bacterium]|nr:hypothetical protein [Patescibacteria group bacterium]
ATDIRAIRLDDKYELEIDFKPGLKKKVCYVDSPNTLKYKQDSPYSGHFIIGEPLRNKGNYLDWVQGGLVEVQKVIKWFGKDYYKVSMYNELDTVRTHTIGGLNFNNVTYKFEVSRLNITTATLSPASLGINTQNILSYCTGLDDLNNSFGFNYRLYKNKSITVSGTYGSGVYSNIAKLVYTYPSASTNVGDNYTVSCQANSSGYVTKWINSSHTVIVNYALDNCTTYTTKAITFNFKNLGGVATKINLSATIDYGISLPPTIGYTYTIENQSTASYCIYPNITFYGDITFQYNYGSNQYNYFTSGTVLNKTTKTVNLYVDTGTAITATVYDNSNERVEGVYIQVQRFDFDSGNYVPVGEYKTNFEGEALLYLTKNSVFYKFLLYYPIGTLKKTTSPTYIYDDTIAFQINLFEDIGQDYFDSVHLNNNLTFNTVTNNFKFAYSDPSATYNRGCLKIYRTAGSDSVLYNSSCISASSGTILLSIDNSSNYCYVGKSFVYDSSSNEVPLDSKLQCFTGENVTGFMGLFVLILMTMAFAFIYTFSIPLGVIMTPLPMLMLSAIGFVPISVGIALSVEIAAVIVAIFIETRG